MFISTKTSLKSLFLYIFSNKKYSSYIWDLLSGMDIGLSTIDAGGVVENYYVSVYDVTNVSKLLTSENVFVIQRDTHIYQYIEFRFNNTIHQINIYIFPSPPPSQQNNDVHRWDGPPFAVEGSNTEFFLTIQGNVFNILYYILTFNQIYKVEVSMLMTISVIHLCLFIHQFISICLLIHSVLIIC